MKRNSFYLTLFVTLIILAACSDFGNPVKVTITTTFTQNLELDLSLDSTSTDTIPPYYFEVSSAFNPLTEPDLIPYSEGILSIELNEFRAVFVTLSQSVNLLNTSLTISGSENSASWLFSDQEITKGSSLSLTNEDGQLDLLSLLLNSFDDITVTFSGQTDSTNFTGGLEVVMDVMAVTNL